MRLKYKQVMETLPDELIEHILLYLRPRDLCACLESAKLFHVLSEEKLKYIKYNGMRPHSFIKRDDVVGYRYAIDTLGRTELLSVYLLKLAIKMDKPLIADFLLRVLHRFDIVDNYIEYSFKHSAIKCIYLWSHLNGIEITGDYSIPFVAGSEGNLETMRSLLFLSGPVSNTNVKDVFPEEATNAVVKTGDFSKMRFIYSLGCRHTSNSWAARGGDVGVLTFLMNHGGLKQLEMSISMAAAQGHDMALKLLFIYGLLSGEYHDVQEYAFGGAASERSLETVRFIHFVSGSTRKSAVLNYAIKRADLNITRWLFLLGYDYYMSSFTIAAQWCSISFMRYAFEKMGLNSDRNHIFLGYGSIFDRAVSFNNIGLAQWLLEKNT